MSMVLRISQSLSGYQVYQINHRRSEIMYTISSCDAKLPFPVMVMSMRLLYNDDFLPLPAPHIPTLLDHHHLLPPPPAITSLLHNHDLWLVEVTPFLHYNNLQRE